MKNILLVEDDIDIQRVYTEKLKISGFNVILALNADIALGYIRNEKPDLILLDIMLPGKMNGFELLEILKKDNKTEKIPVVVLTNLDTERDQALKMGANGYLIKANTPLNDLVEKVKEFMS